MVEVKIHAWRDDDVANVEMTFSGFTDPAAIAEITQAVSRAIDADGARGGARVSTKIEGADLIPRLMDGLKSGDFTV